MKQLSEDTDSSEKMTMFGDLLHGLEDLREQRALLSRVGGLAVLDWWLATTGASTLVPLAANVEDFAWSWVLLVFVVCGFWGTTDTELASVAGASAAAADILLHRHLISEGEFSIALGLKLALMSCLFNLPKLYWIPLGCRAIGFVGALDFVISVVRLQIFLSFLATLYDARHNIVLVVSRCTLGALGVWDNLFQLNHNDVCEFFCSVFPYSSIYLVAKLLWCGYMNRKEDNLLAASATDAVLGSPLGHVWLASLLALASSATKRLLAFQRASDLVSSKLEYPTRDEILAYDDNCGICRDTLKLEESTGPRRTRCGHIFRRVPRALVHRLPSMPYVPLRSDLM